MYIANLQLQNFGAIEKQDFDFSRVNIISGGNGHSKSTVIEAITFLLTNHFPGKIEDYIRWGEKKFSISSNMKHQNCGYNYTVTAGSATDRVLKVLTDGEEETFYKSDASNKMKEIIDPVLTLYSSISQQGESTSILFENDTARLEKLKRIFGMDQIAIVVEQMKEEEREQKIELEKLKSEKSTLDERTFSYQEVMDLDEDSFNTMLLVLKEKEEQRRVYEKDNLVYQKYLSSIEEYDKNKNALKDLGEEKEEIEKKITDSKNSLIELPVYYAEEHSKLEREYTDIENKQKLFLLEQKTFKEKQESCEKITASIKEQEILKDAVVIPKLRKCQYSEEDLINIRENITTLKVELPSLKKKIELGKKGVCAECNQVYAVDVDELVTKESDINIEINKLVEKQIVVKKFIDNFKEISKEKEEALAKVKQHEALMNIHKEQSEELKIWLDENVLGEDNYSSVFLELTKKIKVFEDQKRILQKVEAGNKSVEDCITDSEKRLAEIVTESGVYKKSRKPAPIEQPVAFDLISFEKLKEDIIVFEQQRKEAERIQEQNTKIKKEKEKVEYRLLEIIEFLGDLYKSVDVLKESRKVLDKEFSSYLIEEGSKYISEKMSDIFQESYSSKYNVTFEQNKKSVDFYYGEDGVKAPVITASGFEKKCLAMSFRQALYSIQQTGIFILDEVDSEGDTENSIQLFSTIMEGDFEQIFIISHNDTVKEFLQNNYQAKVFEMKSGSLANVY